MGGNALKLLKNKNKVIRFTLEEYNRVILEIKEKLKDFEISIPYSRPGKDNFGDLDVLIKQRDGVDIKRMIIDRFEPVEIVSNMVYSFSYPSGKIYNDIFQFPISKVDTYYQIDFIPVKSIESAMFYYSYGDIGAIVGKYIAFNGLSFSEDGLGIKIRNKLLGIEIDPYYSHKTINLTSNVGEICSILGVIYDEWLSIKSDADIYEWVTSSCFYDKDAFEFIPMGKRKRLENRPIYQGFLKFIGIDEITDIDKKVKKPINWDHQMGFLTLFNKLEEFETLKDKVIRDIEKRDKFSAEFFIQYGLSGSALGKAISDFKKIISSDNLENWNIYLDSHTKEQIKLDIVLFLD